MNTNDTDTVEVLQEWRDEDGNVDLDAVRSGMVDVRHRDAIQTALLDEAVRARAERDLMAAVLEALDVPNPATEGGADTYRRLLEQRSMAVKSALRTAMDNGYTVPVMAAWLRREADQTPATYQVWGGVR